MEDEKIDKEEVWSAIRYLDPDEREKDKGAKKPPYSQYWLFLSLAVFGCYFGFG